MPGVSSNPSKFLSERQDDERSRPRAHAGAENLRCGTSDKEPTGFRPPMLRYSHL
jgi:hypothetical protein